MRSVTTLLVLLLATPLLAVETGDCARLAALYEIRSLMLKKYSSSYDIGRVIERRVEALREPLGDGNYRWVRWVRRDSDGPVDKKVHKLRGSANPDRFESDAGRVFTVRVVVPSKKSLFGANNPVNVGAVQITTTLDGRTRTRTERIDTVMNPDTSRTFDLGGIFDHVQVAVDASSRTEAVIETHFKQAVQEDDPANPAYATIQSLRRIGDSPDAQTVDSEIASIERSMFASSDPLPVLSIIENLRRADELMRSKKTEEQEKGDKLLKETLRRLR
jgi:hypothetical protein